MPPPPPEKALNSNDSPQKPKTEDTEDNIYLDYSE